MPSVLSYYAPDQLAAAMSLGPSMARAPVALAALMLALMVALHVKADLVLARSLQGSQLQHMHDDPSVSCLRTVSTDCDGDSGVSLITEVLRSKLTSCSNTHDRWLRDGKPVIGQCDYTITWYPHEHIGEDAPYLAGGFYATCDLFKSAEAYVTPSCNKMVLSVQGHIEVVEHVVTDDPTASLLQECIGNYRDTERKNNSSSSLDQQQEATKASPNKGAGSVIASSRELYLVPEYHVMSGPMLVFCHKSGLKWSGWFETPLLAEYWNAKPTTHAEAAGKTFLRPNDVLMEIYQDSHLYKAA